MENMKAQFRPSLLFDVAEDFIATASPGRCLLIGATRVAKQDLRRGRTSLNGGQRNAVGGRLRGPVRTILPREDDVRPLGSTSVVSALESGGTQFLRQFS